MRLDRTKPLDYYGGACHRLPLYLLTVYGKNERANLSKAERNDLAGLVRILKTMAGN